MKYSIQVTFLLFVCISLCTKTFGATRFALNGRIPHQNFRVDQQSNTPDVSIPLVPSPEPVEIEDEEENEPPNLTSIPRTLRFSCRNRIPGFYADPQAGCQVYHQCLIDGRRYSFVCGKGTVFNQKNFVCDHWYNYNCDDAEIDAEGNSRLFFIPEEPEQTTLPNLI